MITDFRLTIMDVCGNTTIHGGVYIWYTTFYSSYYDYIINNNNLGILINSNVHTKLNVKNRLKPFKITAINVIYHQ